MAGSATPSSTDAARRVWVRSCGVRRRRAMARAGEGAPLAEESMEVPMAGGAGGVMRGTVTRAGGEAKGCVVLCHGFRSSRNTRLFRGLVEALDLAGWSTARFDFPGNGDSDGAFKYGNYAEEAEAIAAIVRRVEADAGAGRVRCVLGHSKGANSVLLYLGLREADEQGRVAAAVAVAGRYDVRDGVVERFGREALDELEAKGEVAQRDGRGVYVVSRDGMRERMALDMPAALGRLGENQRGPEVLVIHGRDDPVVPHEDAEKIGTALGGRARVELVPGADHNFAKGDALRHLAASVVAFVDRAAGA